MKTDLLKRIERIEQRTLPGDGITAIFRRIVEQGFIDRPVKGWCLGDGDDRVDVLRQYGETDDDLRERAASMSRVQKSMEILRLISL